MTKAREPSTFQDAVTRIAGRIGWDGAAKAVGQGERVIRYWSDPDAGRYPDINEAMRLDQAYVEAGGGHGPLMAVYALLLERAVTPEADIAALIKAAGTAAKETGEAVAAAMIAVQPGAKAFDLQHADREADEAIDALQKFKVHLGAGATLKVVS